MSLMALLSLALLSLFTLTSYVPHGPILNIQPNKVCP